jgi:hypothetical protein
MNVEQQVNRKNSVYVEKWMDDKMIQLTKATGTMSAFTDSFQWHS